jgi:hypothetical protein
MRRQNTRLRSGDLLDVKSAQEILETLDSEGTLDRLRSVFSGSSSFAKGFLISLRGSAAEAADRDEVVRIPAACQDYPGTKIQIGNAKGPHGSTYVTCGLYRSYLQSRISEGGDLGLVSLPKKDSMPTQGER